MDTNIKIGTRGSKLALWQAKHIAELLKIKGIDSTIITIDTKGDKILDQPFAEIGSKGIFTEEIESKLIEGTIDIAVHSAKDMQSILPPGLEILAFTKREEPNDVVVSLDENFSLSNREKSPLIGTSSARRKALLKAKFPHVRITEARGNLQTRIRKMENGMYDAMILAYAGVHRMNYDSLIREKLSLSAFTPAVGQGSIAIEISSTLEESIKIKLKHAINHADSETCLLAERAYLREMEGGCSIPVFCLATLIGDEISITGGIAQTEGIVIIEKQLQGNKNFPEQLGIELANYIMSNGGEKILNAIMEAKKRP